MPRIKKDKDRQKHVPLEYEYVNANNLAGSNGVKERKKKYAKREDKRNERTTSVVDEKMTSKILKNARIQQLEEQQEAQQKQGGEGGGVSIESLEQFGEAQDLEYYSEDQYDDLEEDQDDGEELEFDIDDKEFEAFKRFLPNSEPAQQTIADIISAKLEEQSRNNKNSSIGDQEMGEGREGGQENGKRGKKRESIEINPKIAQVYKKIGEILSRYKSGPLPKAFKIIPTLSTKSNTGMWQDILDITEPMNWTANAVFMATRIFISNMKPKQAQIFLNTIVLEHVREDIKQNKKLNYHLYMALKKALYKPAAFFKGILFPICEDQYYTTTLKECVIVGSVLAKVSIPVLHSAAALLQLSGSDNGDTDSTYNGAKAIFIRILLDKKYALPYKVIDSLVYYFISFQNINNSNKNFNGGIASDMKLPVLWHQSLLVFSQRYKRDLSPDQRNAILDLVKVHYHHLISEEVRRELTSVNTNFESNYASNNQIDVSMDTS